MTRSPEASRLPSDPDFIVLGLGNPGERYRGTRHNLGFVVVEALARSANAALADGPGPCRTCAFTVGERRGILAEPRTWMNRSGVAARALLDALGGPPPARLLVVVDDLDLPLGRVRFRRGGGAGGHNGLRSILEELGTRDFPRLRLGIGRPEDGGAGDVVDHVLDPFLPEEEDAAREAVGRAAEGVLVFVREGIEAAMNRFNAS